jgi:RimJ/RimL family protein N-acetyltransferase
MAWRVRRAVPDEWWLVRDVRLRSLRDAPEAFGSTYQREAKFGEGRWRDRIAESAWFLAELEPGTEVPGNGTDSAGGRTEPADPIGIVAGIRPESPVEQRHLVAMWVSPYARGSGVARELVDAVVQWARADGATQVSLGVVEDNEPARALYRRLGFAAMGERYPLDSDPTRSIEIFAASI